MISLITGGSGSGKSEFAENYILTLGEEKRIYIATMYPFDKECEKKIERHQRMRFDKNFSTIECYTDLEHAEIPSGSIVLLECMSNLVANELYQENGAGKNTGKAVIKGIRKIASTAKALVVVSNEVFSDGIFYDESTEEYLSYLGQVNRQIGAMADEIVEIVYSIPIYHKKCHTDRAGRILK